MKSFFFFLSFLFSFLLKGFYCLALTPKDNTTTNSNKERFLMPHFFSEVINPADSGKEFVLRFNHGIVRFGLEDIQLQVIKGEERKVEEVDPATFFGDKKTSSESVILKFLHHDINCRLEGAQPLASMSNYFLGSDSTKWERNQQNYSELYYRDLYPGITLKYYMREGRIKYDFIVQAGADIESIQMNYSGINSLSVSTNGALNIQTRLTDLLDYLPESYQMIGDKKVQVQVNYSLLNHNTVGFHTSSYDPRYPLIIDPSLVYSTFIGGTNDEYEYTGGVSLDANGNIYVTGRTLSNNFPATPGAAQTIAGGNLDAFLFKLDPTGSNLIFSTFFGGSSVDAGYTTRIDPVTNDIYLTGTTSSSNFPITAGTLQPFYGGGITDAFTLKINAAGNTLLYSTFMGNLQDDYGAGLDIDNFGNAYIVGQSSGPYPTTFGAYQSGYAGGPWDIFITKLNPGGNGILFSTMIGGPLEDHCHSIKVDSNYDIYIAGMTTGNFPTTGGVFDVSYNGGQWDTYVTKMNSTGTALLFSTYVGGPGADWTWNGLEIDNLGNSYVAGYTQNGFPTTPGAAQNVYGGGSFDAFTYKLNSTGSNLVFSTYVGSTGDDEAWGICLNTADEIFITGNCDYGFPVTSCAYDSTFNGLSDAFITHLNSTGSVIIYSSYIGGNAADRGYNIINQGNFVYVAGSTASVNFPVTPGAYDNTQNGQRDIMVFKMDITAGSSIQAVLSGPGSGCVNSPIQLINSTSGSAISYAWDFGDGTTSTNQNPTHTWAVAGIYTISLIASSPCSPADTASLIVTIYPVPQASFVASELCNLTYSFINTSVGAVSYVWDFGDGNSSSLVSPQHVYTSFGIFQVELIVHGSAACADTLRQSILVQAPASCLFSLMPPICNDTVNFQNLSSNSSSFFWSFGDGTFDTTSNPVHTYNSPGTYSVMLVADPYSCPDTNIQSVIINVVPEAIFNDSLMCQLGVQFNNLSTGAITYIWNFGNGITSTMHSPAYSFPSPGVYTVSLLSESAGGCRDSTQQNISVNASSIAGFTAPSLICDQAVYFQNLSTGASAYFWDFGDGIQQIAINPLHYYSAPGNYTVTLVTDPGACSDTSLMQLTVNAAPLPAFAESSDCLFGFQFLNNSSGGNSSFWNFGDGMSSAQTSPFHTYLTTGQYTVSLLIESLAGCRDSIQQIVQVALPSIAAYTVPLLICTSSVSFINQSQNALTFQWDFGDGAISTSENPVHVYTMQGTYTVLLITNSGICPDTAVQNVSVNNPPVVLFDDSTQCSLFVRFRNLSLYGQTYSWYFGDGDTSSVESPVHTYSTPGQYPVTLEVSTPAGCMDSTTGNVDVLVHALPVFDVAYDTCSQQTFFINKSVSANWYLWNFNDGQNSTSLNPIHSFQYPGIYPIQLVTNAGTICADTLMREISIPEKEESYLYIPNCFTPNGDGINECFEIKGNGRCMDYQLRIFNRWGELIFSSNDMSKCWDGVYNGQRVQVGVYCYLLSDNEGYKQGTVTVLP